MRVPVLLAGLALLAAGCVSSPAGEVEPTATVEGEHVFPGGLTVHAHGLKAGMSFVHVAQGGPMKLTLPAGVLVQDEAGHLLPVDGPVEVADGALVRFLPPYGATSLPLKLEAASGTHEIALPLAEGDPLASGDLAVELLKVQRDQFPHRSPGQPSYEASMDYFAAFFEALGYEVEVSKYGGAGPLPFDGGPGSFSSVVAFKPGASSDRILAMGAHFDVVEATRDGAFDNTAGTVAVLALAKAFANVTTEKTIMFGLWGGEEDGILGSQFWLTSNPHRVPLIDTYVNYDVTALAWPAPKVDPAPIVVAAGPDGPLAAALHAHAADIEETYLQVNATFVHEPVVQGQATGAGVNAQSDHTPFILRGIPSYFQFTERVGDVFALIHSDVDTVDNLTKYALLGVEGLGEDVILTEEEHRGGEWYLARSFSTQMYLGLYYALLVDAGVFGAHAPGSPLPLGAGLP